MKAPICRVCGIAHWGATHVWPGTLRTGIPKPPPSTPAVEAERHKPQVSIKGNYPAISAEDAALRPEASTHLIAPRKRSIASKRSAPPISKPEPPADIEPPEPAPADETPEQRKRRYHREYMRTRREKKAKG